MNFCYLCFTQTRMRMLLILSRHGETEENCRRELQGQLPGTLTPLGWKQAEELAERMADVEFDVVVSSDLARSVNTAKLVAERKGLELHQTPLLREMDWGIYTGQSLEHVAWDDLPEGVETVEMLYERAQRFIDFLKSEFPGKRIFAVGHGAFNRAIEAVITGLEPQAMRSLPIMRNTTFKEFEI